MSDRLTPEQLQPCARCGRPPVHTTGIGLRVTLAHLTVDDQRARAQAGLEMMLGGHASIAAAMGDRAVVNATPLPPVFVCSVCFTSMTILDVATTALGARERAEMEAGR